MRTTYAVSIRRPPDLALILRRIASKRGAGKPYVVADLLRDCLIAYTSVHVAYQRTAAFNGARESTVYVRGNAQEHKYYLELATNQGIALGQVLESAIMHHCGDDIAAWRRRDKQNV